jgi:D-glycero-beta-D-manno-heptose-7-phosphate kinase
MEDIKKLFESFSSLKVGVIGDVMLDTYMWGKVERISPEAPVPVVSLKKQELRIGGAGNVALNIQSLGAQAFLLSVTGNDENAGKLEKLFLQNNIPTDYILKSANRVTTNKIRVISRNQQMMRLDEEITGDLESSDEKNLLKNVASFIEKEDPDVLIFEDYNKGVLTEKVIRDVIELCRKSGVITAADPKRKNFFSYQGIEIFKPNLKEVKEGLNILFDEPETSLLETIHIELQSLLHHDVSFITLSDKGVFYQRGNRTALIPSHLRSIADVSGAGDTVIAVAALVYGATKNVHLMAEIANIAGGMVCEAVGTVAINKEQLLHECELLLS